jgi:tRNA nucleotidyltransferase/poly(A) polymerase
MEEIYKVLRAGAAEQTFRTLVETGLLAALAPEVPARITDSFWQSLAAIDNYRRAFKRNPESLANAILLGSLLIPLGLLDQHHGRTKELGARFGILPLARRDVEFLRQILILQRHLRDPNSCRAHVARASRRRPSARRVLARPAEGCLLAGCRRRRR